MNRTVHIRLACYIVMLFIHIISHVDLCNSPPIALNRTTLMIGPQVGNLQALKIVIPEIIKIFDYVNSYTAISFQHLITFNINATYQKVPNPTAVEPSTKDGTADSPMWGPP